MTPLMTMVTSMCLLFAMLLLQARWPAPVDGMGVVLPHKDVPVVCEVKEITGSFRTSGGSYKTTGICRVTLDPQQFPNEANSWRDFSFTGGGSFESARSIAQEKINLLDPATAQKKGSIVSQWTCNRDPWLSGPMPKMCAKIDFKAALTSSGPGTTTHLEQLVAQYQEILGSFPLSSNLTPNVQAAVDRQRQIAMDGQILFSCMATEELEFRANDASTGEKRNQLVTKEMGIHALVNPRCQRVRVNGLPNAPRGVRAQPIRFKEIYCPSLLHALEGFYCKSSQS